MFYKGNVAT